MDFGSQYTWLLARSFRELSYPCEVKAYNTPLSELKKENPLAFVLSGGPSSVFHSEAPKRSVRELLRTAPCLGICYGMHLICKDLGGKVKPSSKGTYGAETIKWKKNIFSEPFQKTQKVWMSHGDIIEKLPEGLDLLAVSSEGIPSAFSGKNLWAFQFHPEVQHTDGGKKLLRAFVKDFCGQESGAWTQKSMMDEASTLIQKTVPKSEKVLCALSGGVDSTVTAVLLTKVLGKDRTQCLFVDTGFLRQGEFKQVLSSYKQLDLNIQGIQASDFFLSRIKKISDPEKKRQIIGHSFVDIFKKHKDPKISWLAQGTLYPDVIESFSPNHSSAVIKSHHNVGGLPKDLNLNLIEPLRNLFKDEVRLLGKQLGISHDLLNRHPFPGPGLAIRVLGEVTQSDLDLLRSADHIFISELKKQDLYNKVWQAFCVLLPCRSVGVQGDHRTFEKTLVLRAVVSQDGMTADWFSFDSHFLKTVSNKITNQVKGINRVVYDITSKPPGTIEWE